MPRANFQSADYSTLFADIYKQSADAAKTQADNVQSAADSDMYDKWQNKLITDAEWTAYINTRLAATASDADPTQHEKWVQLQRQVQTQSTKQAEAAAKAKQDAQDSDTYDQWKNGLISNQEWLDYIAQRVAATKGDTDPAVNEKWVQLQRQYTRSIADAEAQGNYESGKMSPAQYIAYLKQSLVGLDSGSQAYQDRQLAITKLIDTQIANDTTARAKDLTEKIKNGTGTYEQLLAVYQEAAKKARPGSDIANQIADKITAVQDAIQQNAVQGSLQRIDYLFKSGHMTGTEAGKQIRAIAGQYFKNDQTKYYQTLLGALQYEKYKGTYGAGSGGGGRGGGGSRSAAAAQKTVVAQLRANITRGNDISQQYLRGDSQIVDSGTGKVIHADPKTIHGVQLQTLAAFDQLHDAYARNHEPKQAANVAKAKQDFIRNAVQPANTVQPAVQTQHFMSAISADLLSTAKANNDPLVIMKAYNDAADKIDAFVKNLSTTTKTTPVTTANTDIAAGLATSNRPVTKGKPDESLPMPQLLAELHASSAALRAVATPGATAESVQAVLDYAKKTTGKFVPDSVLTPVLKVGGQQNADWTDLQTGKKVLFMGPDGPGAVPSQNRAVGLSGQTQLEPAEGGGVVGALKKGEDFTQIYVDINGVPTQVWAKMSPVKSDYNGWQAQAAVLLRDAQGNTWHFKAGDFIPSSLIGDAAPPKNEGKKNESPGLAWDDYIRSGAIAAKPVNLRWMAIPTGAYTDNGKTYAAKVWFGDPVTGTWSVGHPPVVGDLNPDGTLRFDDSQNPSINYKPLGTAGSVPTVYVGSNPKAMQGIYDTQDASGMHTGLMSVDATGNVVPAAPGTYHGAYYDPAMSVARDAASMPSSSPTADDNWWKQSIQDLKVNQARQTATDQLRLQAHADNKNRGAAFDPKGLSAGLGQFGASLGITGSGFGTDQKASDTLATGINAIPTQVPTAVVGGRGMGAPTLAPISQPNSAVALGNVPLPAPAPAHTGVSAPSVKLPDVHPTASAKISVPPPPSSLKSGPSSISGPSQDLLGTGHPATSSKSSASTKPSAPPPKTGPAVAQ